MATPSNHSPKRTRRTVKPLAPLAPQAHEHAAGHGPAPLAQGEVIGMPHTLRSHRPDRASRAFLRWVNLYSRVPLEDRPVRVQRLAWRLMALAMGHRPGVGTVSHRAVPGPGGPIELRIFTPAGPSDTARPAFLWCHGGGFMVGGLDTADAICRSIARRAGCIVVAVRYRLAPEHALTASREDFLAALQWVTVHGASLGIDATRLAIGGDSAGGNVSAAVAQHVARLGGPPLRLQVLVYPATDLLHQFPSLAENAHGYMVSARQIDKIAHTVVIPPNAADPWLSPRRSADLRGLAPAVVVSAGFDPIRDDGLDYSARLRAAGVPVQLLHYPGQFHGFMNFDTVIGAGSDALLRVGDALAAAFRGEAAADCTLEVADKPPAARLLRAAAGEMAITSLVGWVAAERFAFTLLGRLSPGAACATRRLLESRFVPSALAQRSVLADGQRLAVRQTYPAA